MVRRRAGKPISSSLFPSCSQFLRSSGHLASLHGLDAFLAPYHGVACVVLPSNPAFGRSGGGLLRHVTIGRHAVVGPLAHVVAPLPGSAAAARRGPTVPDGCRLPAMASTDRFVPGSSATAQRNLEGSFTPLLPKRDQCAGLMVVLVFHAVSLLPAALLTRAAVAGAVAAGGGGGFRGVAAPLASALALAASFTVLPGVAYCALLVAFKRLVVGAFLEGESQDTDAPREGCGPLFGAALGGRFRFWIWSRLLGSPLYLGTMFPLSFTPVVPWFLRLLGAKIGRNVWMVPPNSLAEFDVLEVGDGCFSGGDYALFPTGSDGVTTRLVWGEESGVTDRALCLSGASLGRRSVVGDMTTVGGGPVPPESITVGDPNMRFPLPKTSADHSSSSGDGGGDAPPPAGRHAALVRAAMSVVPLLLGPALLLPGLAVLMPMMLVLHDLSHASSEAAACAPVSLSDVHHLTIALVLVGAYLVVAFGTVWAAATFKRVCVGAIGEGRHPFASLYMLKWASLNFSVVPLVQRLFLRPLRGSPFFNSFLRLNGATVGSNVLHLGVLEAAADFDMLTLGDGAVVELDVRLQAHEVINAHIAHRPIVVGERAHVGGRSNLLAGSVLHARSRLADQSLLLGRSEAKPGSSWDGLPATVTRAASALRPSSRF